MLNKFLKDYWKINRDNHIKSTLSFLILFSCFFIYYVKNPITDIRFSIFVNILFLIIFLISVFKSKYGLYMFIFLVPLLNTLNTILEVRSISIILLLFFGLFLGFFINSFAETFSRKWHTGPSIYLDQDFSIPILAFIVLIAFSAGISILRYSNFFPFITNNYHNLIVNKYGFDSTSAIYTALSFFFNYIIGFGLLLVISNSLKKIREIVITLLIIVGSTIISFFVLLYQYFINPYLGSFLFWINSGRFNATFTDPNALGAYTVILFPIFIILIIISRKLYLKIIFSILCLPLIFMVYLSGSRSALVGLFLEIFIFAIIGLVRFIKKRSTNKKRISKIKKIITIIIAIVIFAVLMSSIFVTYRLYESDNPLVSNIGVVSRTMKTLETAIHYYNSAGLVESLKSISNYRYIYWGQAINMTRDYPVSGVGLGAYTIELPNYLKQTSANFWNVDFVGNYYLQILSELGIPGLILVLFLFYLIIRKSYIYLKKRNIERSYSAEDWLLRGLLISFIASITILIFGPHINFMEIQVSFWFVISILITYIKIKDPTIISSREQPYFINKKRSFDVPAKISFVLIIVIFSFCFFMASFTSLSINVGQNLYDVKDRYHGWKNYYGFYGPEKFEKINIRWTGADASEVLTKEGSVLIIPMRDGIPKEYYSPVYVKIFINNYLSGIIKLDNNKWEDIKINIPESARDRFTLTLSVSRPWIPKVLNINKDTRELGVMVGDYIFTD